MKSDMRRMQIQAFPFSKVEILKWDLARSIDLVERILVAGWILLANDP